MANFLTSINKALWLASPMNYIDLNPCFSVQLMINDVIIADIIGQFKGRRTTKDIAYSLIVLLY